ncbi:MAG: alkaline phosphatase PhoX [Myxococcota bacterium]|nr:alkaline phosphatase PhoX [Myxococcota bacterium]
MIRRREFVGVTGVTALSFFVTGCIKQKKTAKANSDASTVRVKKAVGQKTPGFGPLEDRVGQLLDLPKGFSYTVIQTAGDAFSDGFKMPQQPDGMACFPGPEGQYILLRNHELGDQNFVERYGYSLNPYPTKDVPTPCYTPGFYGGVTRVVLQKDTLLDELKTNKSTSSKAVLSSNFVLAGTDVNCAGGQIPGGWVTCEESGKPDHGYAFLTKPTDSKLTQPRRISSWGRFPREAVALDPKTGIVYMTEDRKDGLFYRHVPKDPKAPMGAGQLQALSISGVTTTSPYERPENKPNQASVWAKNQNWTTRWVDIGDPSAAKQTCREQGAAKGATQFMRGEGITWDGQAVWFSASLGGPVGAGQIFHYEPDAVKADRGKLHLRYEVDDRSILSCPDNILVAPWGDLIMAEDNYRASNEATHQYIRAMTAEGEIYDIARNRNNFPDSTKPGGEFTGACFSPDGQVLFVNIQTPENVTVAISGPWV